MASKINSGDYIDYTPGSAVSAGDVVVLSEVVGIADADIPANELGALSLEGNYEVACLGTDVVSIGDKLYWDAGAGEATLTASTHKVIGYATTASANGVVTVGVKLTRG